jgi:hypothetical protein
MKIEFRLVHFVPDPFSGARIPVGALVKTASGTEVVIPEEVPGQKCLHAGAAAILRDLLNDLRQLNTFPQSVGTLSQHLVQSELKSLEIDVSVKEWFERAFFPVTNPRAKDHPSQPRRSTEGKLFLKQYGVDSLVQSTFRPNDYWTGSGHSAAFKSLKPISQYVGTADTELLLMEPLVPHRASFKDDVRDVNTQFAAYRFYMDETQSRAASLVVYILPNEDQKQRDYAIEALSDSAHLVVDASKEAQRKDFIERIRSIGPTAMLL